jgi:hypothetical protein
MPHSQPYSRIHTNRLQQVMQLPKLRGLLRQRHQIILQKPALLRVCYDKHRKPPGNRLLVVSLKPTSEASIFQWVNGARLPISWTRTS